MKRLLVATLVALAAPAFAPPQAPPSIVAALAQAQPEHKPLLFDFTAVSFCSCYSFACPVPKGE